MEDLSPFDVDMDGSLSSDSTLDSKVASPIPPLLLPAIAVIGFLTLDFFALSIIGMVVTWVTLPIISNQIFQVMIGQLVGQYFLAVVACAMWPRHWIYGIIGSSVFGMLALSAFLAGESVSNGMFMDFGADAHVAVLFLPLAIAIGAIPLFAARYWWGWTFGVGDNQAIKRTTRGTEGLFAMTAVAAGLLILARIPQVYWEVSSMQFWPSLITAGATLCVFCAAVVVPVVYFRFRSQSELTALIAHVLLTLLALFGLSALTVIPMLLTGTPGLWWEVALGILVQVLVISLVVYVGLWVLRFSGFGLTRYAAVQDFVTDETPTRAGRWCVVAVLVFCGAANLAIGRLESRRRTVDDGLRTLGRGVVAGGGEMTVLNREIEELKFGESTTDEDVRIALSTHSAKRIDLSNTQITDASAAYLPRLPGLESLDLGHCEITAASIPNLLKCKDLKHLGLAGTQLSVSEIKELMGGLPLLSIDLSEVSLSVSDLKEVLDGFQGSVALRGNQLTDQDVLELLGTAYNSLGRTFVANPDDYSGSLDLSDNPITGTYLAKTDASIVRLTLYDCPVTDAAFVSAIDSSLQELRLARTKLTDAVIPSFNTIFMLETLELGEGKITDDGLATMPVQQISRLSLNAEQFTGKCFEIWQPYLGELDLSYSGVSDRTIRSLQSLNYLPLLDLSHTKLSDAALSSLANISALRVDIRDTAITAEGLAATDFVTVQQIVVGFDQFTDEELRLIESKITVDVGGIGRHQEQP